MLLRQTLLYLPAQVVGPLAQFVSVILWTHFLSPAEMGLFALIVAAQELIYSGALFWFTIFTMRFFDRSDADAFLATERVVLVATSCVSALAMLALPLVISTEWSSELAAASVAYAITRSLGAHLADRARAGHDTVSYSILQIAWPIAGFLLALAFVATWEQTAAAVLWGYAAGQLIALAIAAPRLGFGQSFKYSPDIARAAYNYGWPLVLGATLMWVANNGIRFLLEAREGAEAVGLATVGWGLGLRAASFAAMLVTAAAFPLAVLRSREDGMSAGQHQLVRNGVLLLAVLAPAGAGLWSISTPLVDLIVAEPFRAATAELLPWAILAGVARNFRMHVVGQVFLLREETRIALANDAFDAAATMLTAAIGLIWGGVIGCVIGASIGSVIGLAGASVLAAWHHEFYLPPADLARIGAATAAMAAAVSAMPATPTVLSLSAAVALGAAVYAAALAALYLDHVQDAARKLRQLADARG